MTGLQEYDWRRHYHIVIVMTAYGATDAPENCLKTSTNSVA